MSQLFMPVKEACRDACHATGDYLERTLLRKLRMSKFVYKDLQLDVVKSAKRQFFEIDKSTNTVDMNCDFMKLSSVSVMDKCGVIYPLYRNDVLHDDIVDIAGKKNCVCKCGGDLCNLIKSYETIQEDVVLALPDNSTATYTKTTRKIIDDGGNFYEEITYPELTYEEGVYSGVSMTTDYNELCKLELNPSTTCPTDSKSNWDKINNCGCNNTTWGECNGYNTSYIEGATMLGCVAQFQTFTTDCGCGYVQPQFSNIYNITELGDRLIFPKHFCFDKVLVRFYEKTDLKNMQIPRIALSTFITGLKYYENKWVDKKQNLKLAYGSDYGREQFKLISDLNKYRVEDYQMIITPPRYVS